MKKFFTSLPGLILTGGILGGAAFILQYNGNPPNMGLCLGCFMRDTAGGIGLHRFLLAQYIRPEVVGVVLGAMAIALFSREWKARSSSAPFVFLFLGVFAMLGLLIFLGCPWRALIRIGGGDLNGVIGLAGLAAGSILTVLFTKWGFSLGESKQNSSITGYIFPLFMGLLVVLVYLKMTTSPDIPLSISKEGPGALKAPFFLSLGIGVIVGLLIQKSKFCVVGAFKNIVGKDFRLLCAILSFIVVILICNIFVGTLRLGFLGMPISHTAYFWSFAGMFLCGLAFSLAGGCPGRQLVKAGEGDSDSAIFCIGLLLGAGICHNWKLIAAPDSITDGVVTIGGPTTSAIIALVVGVIFCIVIGLTVKESKGLKVAPSSHKV